MAVLAELQPRTDPIESKRAFAKASGKFYAGVIDIYLSRTSPQERWKAISESLDLLPPHAKNLYFEGLVHFEDELKDNKRALDSHRGNEVDFLLTILFKKSKKKKAEIKQLLKEARGAVFIEPVPGAAIVEVPSDFYEKLKKDETIHPKSYALYQSRESTTEPSFCLVQKPEDKKSIADPDTKLTGFDVRHEFHHMLWNFLEISGYTRKVDDRDFPDEFRNFRDELGGYIIDGESRVERVDIDLLVHSNKLEALKQAKLTRNLVHRAMSIGQSKGVPAEAYLYAVLSARSFGELEDNVLKLTPAPVNKPNFIQAYKSLEDRFNQGINIVLIEKLFEHYSTFKGDKLKYVARQLKKRGLDFPSELMTAFVMSEVDKLAQYTGLSIADIRLRVDRLLDFASKINVKIPQVKELCDNWIKGHLRLPEKTKDLLLSLPFEMQFWALLDSQPKKFLMEYIRFDGIDEVYNLEQGTGLPTSKESSLSFFYSGEGSAEPRWKVYQRVIDSDPLMRQTFDAAKEEIIEEAAQRYSSHFQDSDFKPEFEKYTRIVRSL